MTRTLQIRDLDEETLDTLKSRAALSRMSLSAYVARELAEAAAAPTNAEVLSRARELAELGGGASDADIVATIREARQG